MEKAVTIGTFDGVHLGHQFVLEMLRCKSMMLGMQPIAMTFDRHPLELICPQRAPGNLMSTRRKVEWIRSLDVTPIVLTFNEQLRNMRAYEWLDHIHRKYDVGLLLMGYDNTFGSDGIDLSLADLSAMGDSVGIKVIQAAEVPDVSSSKVRKTVKSGDIAMARKMLGHEPETEGRIIRGFHVGTDIGFPTANLQADEGLVVPLQGVYAARAFIEDSREYHPAMVNIGMRPTFDGTLQQSDHPSIEAHIIGLDEDIYGKRLRLEWLDRLRDEKKFNSIGALRTQLEKDKKITMDLYR
ncbi:MAG: riboflavin biosynthesis protein RibF [Muribaculum sp.]|nr:riboflavin biosynthesis protein RibF [Muribaculum sp.]